MGEYHEQMMELARDYQLKDRVRYDDVQELVWLDNAHWFRDSREALEIFAQCMPGTHN